METDAIADLPASFTWEQRPDRPGITMVAHLDIAHLRFVKAKDRRVERLIIIAAQFAKTGFTAAVTIQAPPGAYSARAVAQDGVEGKMAAAGNVLIK